jgi:RNA polymerase sigma-70 factor (ECF subfamily)
MRDLGLSPQTPPVAPAPSPSFRDIFDAELGYVWKTLRRLGVHERDREDVANEVFMVVHRQLVTFDATRPLRPWLFGIAFRRALDYRRLARNQREQLEAEPTPEFTEDAGDRLAARELLEKALRQLDPERRALVIMHDVEGWPVPEIARVLEMPVQTVYSRLRVAREELNAAVRRLELRGGGR